MAHPTRRTVAVPIERVDGLGLQGADRRPRVGRDVSPGNHHSRGRRGHGRRNDRHRLHLRRRVRRGAGPRFAGGRRRAAATPWPSRRLGRRWSQAVRNLGRPGIASMAISAVDAALWDLKARAARRCRWSTLLGRPCATRRLFTGAAVSRRTRWATSESNSASWAAAGIKRVKMKSAANPTDDPSRVRAAREAIGRWPSFSSTPTVPIAASKPWRRPSGSPSSGVTWFEEPVRRTTSRASPDPRPSAGGHGHRCGRIWLRPRSISAGCSKPARSTSFKPTRRAAAASPGSCGSAALCKALVLPLSAHCAPTLHAPLGCAWPDFRHLEYFHDHDRIEHLLFDGAPCPAAACCARTSSRPGSGIEFRRQDAARYAHLRHDVDHKDR